MTQNKVSVNDVALKMVFIRSLYQGSRSKDIMDQKPTRKKQRKPPRKATAASLENAALYYLERFATSSENLRRVLMRRVERLETRLKLMEDEQNQGIDLTRFYKRPDEPGGPIEEI